MWRRRLDRPQDAAVWRGALAGRLAAFLLGMCAAGPALAHSPFGADAAFWTGAWHLLLSPLSVAALLGLGAACGGIAAGRQIEIAALAGLACFLVSWVLPAEAARLAPLPVLAVGAGAALAVAPTGALMRSLAVLAGAGAGAALDLDVPSLAGSAGAAALLLVAGVWSLELGRRVRQRLPLALRVAGAWIAALSLLLLALRLV